MIALIILILFLILQPPPSSKDGPYAPQSWSRPHEWKIGGAILGAFAEPCNFDKYVTGCSSQSNLICDTHTGQCVCTSEYPILIEGRWCHKKARYFEKCQYNQQCDNSNGFYCLYSDNETLIENRHPFSILKSPTDYARCRCKSKGFRHPVIRSSQSYPSSVNNSNNRNQTSSLLPTKPHRLKSSLSSSSSSSLSINSYNAHNNDEISQGIESCLQPAAINQQCDLDVQCEHWTKYSICDETTKRCRCDNQHYYDNNKKTCEEQPECRYNDSSDRISQCYKFNASSRRCEKVGFFCSLPRFIWIFLFICVAALLIFLLTIRSQYNPSLFTDDRLSITSNNNVNDHRQRRHRRTVDSGQQIHQHPNDLTGINGSRNGSINSSLTPAIADLPCEFDVPPPYEVAINMKS